MKRSKQVLVGAVLLAGVLTVGVFVRSRIDPGVQLCINRVSPPNTASITPSVICFGGTKENADLDNSFRLVATDMVHPDDLAACRHMLEPVALTVRSTPRDNNQCKLRISVTEKNGKPLCHFTVYLEEIVFPESNEQPASCSAECVTSDGEEFSYTCRGPAAEFLRKFDTEPW